MRNRVDDPAQRVIVLRHHRRRRKFAGAPSVGVVVGQPDVLQVRHVAVVNEIDELAAPFLDAIEVAVVEVPTHVTRVVESGQTRHGRVDHLAVIAKRDARGLGVLPDVTVEGDHCRRERVVAAAAGVGRRPHAFDEIGIEGRVCPVVSGFADLAARVSVVEEAEARRERMLVGRHARAERCQLRIAVALRHVAEHLIVRPIFFENEEDVRNGAAGANDGAPLRAGPARGALWIAQVRDVLG